MTDFSVPQRMSFGAFIIYFLKFFKLVLNASIIYLIYEIFKSDGDLVDNMLKIAAMTGCAAALGLIMASLAFFQIKIHIKEGNLIYRHKLISRETTTIPLDRIHTLRTRRGLLYRLLQLRGIFFDTLASKTEEVELILSESDWQSLLALVEQQERPRTDSPDMPPAYNPTSNVKFSNRDLLLDALCQNHMKGMVVLGGFATAIFNSVSDLPENSINIIAGHLESHLGYFAWSVAGIAVILLATYALSLLLWLGKVLLRYYDLSLSYTDKVLTFSHGLLSRLSCRFSHGKICTVWIKRNYLEKRFGLCTLALKQALNTSAQKEEDNLKIYGQDCSDFFLGWWLGEDYKSQKEIISAKSGKGVITRSLLPDLLISAIAMTVLWNCNLYGWMTLPLIYMLVSVPKGVLTMRHSYISLRESYLIIGKGRFAETTNYLKYNNVEVVRITRSPLSRLTGRVSLSLSTPGSSFTTRSLKEDQALLIYELLLVKSNTDSRTSTKA